MTGKLVKRLRKAAHVRCPISADPVNLMEWEAADCIEAIKAECAIWKDACHSAESRIEHFLTRTSSLESAERVVEAAHRGEWRATVFDPGVKFGEGRVLNVSGAFANPESAMSAATDAIANGYAEGEQFAARRKECKPHAHYRMTRKDTDDLGLSLTAHDKAKQ